MRPHPRRTITDPTAPQAWGVCDRSGFVANHKDLRWQYEYAGPGLINTRRLVVADMLDEPQRQLGTIMIPPDPPPIFNARPEQYSIDENPVTGRVTMNGTHRIIEGYLPSIRIISGDLAV